VGTCFHYRVARQALPGTAELPERGRDTKPPRISCLLYIVAWGHRRHGAVAAHGAARVGPCGPRLVRVPAVRPFLYRADTERYIAP